MLNSLLHLPVQEIVFIKHPEPHQRSRPIATGEGDLDGEVRDPSQVTQPEVSRSTFAVL